MGIGAYLSLHNSLQCSRDEVRTADSTLTHDWSQPRSGSETASANTGPGCCHTYPSKVQWKSTKRRCCSPHQQLPPRLRGQNARACYEVTEWQTIVRAEQAAAAAWHGMAWCTRCSCTGESTSFIPFLYMTSRRGAYPHGNKLHPLTTTFAAQKRC